MQLRRVRKEDSPPAVKQDIDPLDICLSCWKMVMSGDSDKDLGAKSMRLLSGDGDGYGNSDPWDSQEKRDREIGDATDAMIDSLKPLHRWAIYKLQGVSTVWMYPNADLLQVGPAALDELRAKLRVNICTRALF